MHRYGSLIKMNPSEDKQTKELHSKISWPKKLQKKVKEEEDKNLFKKASLNLD